MKSVEEIKPGFGWAFFVRGTVVAEGYLAFVLHAHLPYVRHPEHETFLEEQWFFEAITETYIPLLKRLERLEDDGVDYALLVSLSPPLVTMFEDTLLQERYVRHLKNQIALAERECRRTADDAAFNKLARYYLNLFKDTLYWFETRYARRLAKAFQHLASFGHLELMTCAGTHGFLPFLKVHPQTVRAQVRTAVDYHQSVFGVHPQGMWVPECAYYPGLDEILHEAGVRYFFVDSHGIDNADPHSPYGVYAPVYTPNGVAAFGRDKETSYQVWAAEVGYPGHPVYREFYRDIGFELPEEDVKDFIIADGVRVNSGMKYYRITKDGDRKDPYDPDEARERAAEDAGNFIFNREHQIRHLCGEMDRKPLIVSMYDAELFGHWWYEGPQFLDYVIRKMCYDQDVVELTTPLRYLAEYSDNPATEPAQSSWGALGTFEYWLNETNDSILPDLHTAAERLSAAIGTRNRPLHARDNRILKQMARELLIAQASDWPFIMRTGTSPEYAVKRVKTHLSRFYTLEAMLDAPTLDEETLQAIEYADRIFPDIKVELFKGE